MVERVTVSEHFLAVEYVPVHAPERRARPRKTPEMSVSDLESYLRHARSASERGCGVPTGLAVAPSIWMTGEDG